MSFYVSIMSNSLSAFSTASFVPDQTIAVIAVVKLTAFGLAALSPSISYTSSIRRRIYLASWAAFGWKLVQRLLNHRIQFFQMIFPTSVGKILSDDFSCVRA